MVRIEEVLRGLKCSLLPDDVVQRSHFNNYTKCAIVMPSAAVTNIEPTSTVIAFGAALGKWVSELVYITKKPII